MCCFSPTVPWSPKFIVEDAENEEVPDITLYTLFVVVQIKHLVANGPHFSCPNWLAYCASSSSHYKWTERASGPFLGYPVFV